MDADNLKAPLAALNGERPDAPAWFRHALGHAPSRTHCEVDGARIETLVWGERGRPGLLFLHGNAAHADWWSFVAPFFAREFRVAAMSWSGMGGSQWRPTYSLDIFVAEAFAAAGAAGLFDGAARPIFVGHSFGGFPLLACAARRGEELRAAIVVDTPLLPPERVKEQRERMVRSGMPSPGRVYPTLAAALARFRLLPSQPCENLFIVDFIARTSLREADGGFAWRFDPLLWRHYRMSNPIRDLASARCPVAIVRGSRSRVMTEDSGAFAHAVAPAGSPLIEIPEAHHHVMLDQPLAFVSALRGLLSGWPAARPYGAAAPERSIEAESLS